MDLNELVVFARVVQSGSFTGAAKALGLPKSTVSRRVSELETRLKARLLQRTTRRLSLTDVGRTYFEYCSRIVAELEEAERAVGAMQARPAGLLRVTAPVSFSFLGPLVAGYLARYPDVRLELVCTDRVVDLVEERFDVAIRAGSLSDSSLIARPLGTSARYIVAAPSWVKRAGRPRGPEGLRAASWLWFGSEAEKQVVTLSRGREQVELKLHARLVVNDLDLLKQAAHTGLGVALVSAFHCSDDLAANALERLLPAWAAPPTPIHAVYPSTRHVTAKVKHFIDHLQEQIGQLPWATSPAAA